MATGLVATLLTEGNSASNGATTATVSPSSGSVIYLFVVVADTSVLTAGDPSVSLTEVATTWTLIDKILYSSRRELHVYRGDGAFTSETITLTWSNVPTFGQQAWAIIQVTGQEATPNGTPQKVYDSNTSSSSIILPDLGAADSGDDAILAGFCVEDSDAAPSLSSPLITLANQTGLSDVRSLQVGWDGGALTDLTPQTSHTSSRGGAVGFVLKGTPVGGGGISIPVVMNHLRNQGTA